MIYDRKATQLKTVPTSPSLMSTSSRASSTTCVGLFSARAPTNRTTPRTLLLFGPHINQEKEAENSSVSCSPASAFLWCWCSSFYIGRWLVAKLRYKYLKRLSWIVSTAFSKALELEDPLLFDPHIDHDKEAENSCVSCSPASAFSWRWHSSFYICHSDGSYPAQHLQQKKRSPIADACAQVVNTD